MSMQYKDTNETICINPKGGRAGIPGLQPSLQDRIYDINGIATACTVCFNPNILENYSLVSNSKSFKEIKEKGEKIMNKPKLSVVSCFSGSGFQEMGVKNCDLFDVDVVATCDLDNYTTVAYAAIHNGMTEEMVENYDYPSRSQMADDLIKLNMGYDFKSDKAYDWAKKARGKDKFLNKVWLACYLNNNLGDIACVKELPECDLLFFSSPCTDYSVAGAQEGSNCTCDDCGHVFNPFDIDVEHRDKCPNCGSDNIQGTRSGQLAEVERLLVDMKKKDILPKYCILENVDALVSKKFKPDFDKWCKRMENLGYNTYWQVLNGKECGIPQNRKRVFALWIRKDIDNCTFTFPKPFDNGKRLKDVLEEEVDEKYYIENDRSRKLIDDLIANGSLSWIGDDLESTTKSEETKDAC